MRWSICQASFGAKGVRGAEGDAVWVAVAGDVGVHDDVRQGSNLWGVPWSVEVGGEQDGKRAVERGVVHQRRKGSGLGQAPLGSPEFPVHAGDTTCSGPAG